LNRIHCDDPLDVLHLYPDFAQSFIERFRLTFDLHHVRCQDDVDRKETECLSLILV
jgi:hypothetical protein